MQKSLRFKPKRINRISLSRRRSPVVERFALTTGRSSRGWWLLTISCLLIFIVGLVVGNIELTQRREKLKRNLSDLKNQLEGINNGLKNNQTDNLIDNSPAYLERVAREELNLRKPGENVVAFPSKVEEEVDKTEGLLQKIKDKPK